ncbi:MAG: DNA adenine methylase [Candidatus Spyradenecus sp.]
MPYGLPYQGSKSRIAEKILAILPPADTLIDLFAGGCAITHAALLSGKYQHIIANDLSPYPSIFLKAATGSLDLTPRWIDRQTFHETKESDPLTALLYSFGNKTDTYAYSREIEPFKRAAFHAITGKTLEARRLAFRAAIGELFRYLRTQSGGHLHLTLKQYASGRTAEAFSFPDQQNATPAAETIGSQTYLERLQRVASLERLQRVDSLERLQRVASLERLSISRLDYRSVTIPPGAIIYADPPYNETQQYNATGPFDSATFYTWAANNPSPIFLSEYNAPPPFSKVAEFSIQRNLGRHSKHTHATERLYANPPAARLLASSSLPVSIPTTH